jgi:hypothetical protein
MQRVIEEIFSHKNQLPRHFIWTPKDDVPHIRNVLSVSGETGVDAQMLNMPSVISMSEMERNLHRNLGKYDDAARTCEYIPISTDLDAWAEQYRNEALYITTSKVDPKDMQYNPMDTLFSIFDSINDTEEDGPANDDDDAPSDPEYEDYKRPSRTFGYEEAADDMPEDENDAIERDIMEREEQQQAPPQQAEPEPPEDDPEIIGRPDFKYDASIGYFMGVRLDRMFMEDTKSLEKLTPEHVFQLYSKLDDTGEPPAKDYDFDPEEFFVRVDENGRRYYHWDVIAKEDYIEFGCNLRDAPFVWYPDEEWNAMSDKDRKYICDLNSSRYKMVCYNPLIRSDFENEKCYHDKDLQCYPQDMEKTAVETRRKRWERAQTRI